MLRNVNHVDKVQALRRQVRSLQPLIIQMRPEIPQLVHLESLGSTHLHTVDMMVPPLKRPQQMPISKSHLQNMERLWFGKLREQLEQFPPGE